VKYKLLNYYIENEVEGFDVNHILKARGLDSKAIKVLMNLDDSVLLDPFDMKNMKEGIELLNKHVVRENKILVLNDEDVDGQTSSSLLYLTLKEMFGEKVNINYMLNKNKAHGVDLEHFEKFDPSYDYDLLVVPDASACQKEVDFLKEKGVDVLILDHHITKNPAKGAITINPNQTGCEYENKDLSGVGVVYKFLQAYVNTYDIEIDLDKYLDLVALGMIGDVMSLKSPETRHLINKGLKQMQERRDKIFESEGKYFPTEGNKLINAFLHKKYDYDLKKLTHKNIAFKIAPFINGCIRSGTHEEKDEMFKAFLGSEEKVTYQPRRKKKTDPKPELIEMPLYKDMVRRLTNVKSRQTREMDKAMKILEEKIEDKDLLKGKVLIVDATGLVENKSLTGLVAQKLCSKYMKPTIILKKKDDEYFGGSCRNFSMSPIESFKDLIDETGLAEGLGHDNAMGINVKIEDIVEVYNSLNEKLKDVELEKVYRVDSIIPFRKLTSKKVLEIGKLAPLWGADLKCPQFIIKGVTVPVSDIERIGDKGTIVRFKKGDHSFYKFYANEDTANEMRMRKTRGFGNKNPKYVTFDLLCEFEVHEYEGCEYGQIVIQDYTVKPKEEVLF
jgi:single-stranded-DNA-specific exonuclease